jgi:hypothetical protein
MAIKNVLKVNRVQVNKFQLTIAPGVGSPLFTTISGLEEELDTVDLPDRTSRSGGREKQLEFEVQQPMHHDLEVLAMEAWYRMCKMSLPLYLKLGTLVLFDEWGIPRRRYTLPNLWISKRSHSELDLDNDGEMSTITWTLKADQIIPM